MRKVAVLIAVAAAWTIGCNAQSVRVPMFENDPRAIIIPVQIGDNFTGRFSFDTGAYMNCFYLDSTFVAGHPLELWTAPPDATYPSSNSTWVNGPVRYLKMYNKKIGVTIAGAKIEYPYFGIIDLMSDFSAHVDGMLNLPREDTTHVWELNFENDYLEIHDAADFRMPDNCRLFPLIMESRSNNDLFKEPYIRFPFTITTSDGGQVTIEEDYLIDTGALMDFAILDPAPELAFFRQKEPQTLVSYGSDDFRSRYNVNAVVFGDTPIDSMRVYTIEGGASLNANYVIGLNFFKRFNVFFDLSTRTIGLQPIDNFQRIVNPDFRRFHYSFRYTPEGQQLVERMAPIRNNCYREAGLREGDIIVAVNGIAIQEITQESVAMIRNSTPKILDILRNGVPLTLTVHIPPDELLGE